MGVVREAAEYRMETFNPQRERAETSQINGGNTEDGLSDRKKEKQKDEQSSAHFLNPPSLTKQWQMCTFHLIIH